MIRCSSKLLKTPALAIFKPARMYTAVEKGTPNTLDYRVFYTSSDGTPISPFHDIPLYADSENKYCNMVVEIPRWTNAKMEICKEENLNPIKQDIKKGKLRYVNNVFPYHGYIWNYGALPQTWEDPSHVDTNTKCKGDDDPLDVVEIGAGVAKRGEVKQVKILGVLAMIDEEETDWKIVCIDRNDPMADQLNDIKDIETHMPGYLEATRDWFRIYKVPTGKPMNDFAFEGVWKDKAFAQQIIHETNGFWRSLINNKEHAGIQNTTQSNSAACIPASEAHAVLNKHQPLQPAPEVDSSTHHQKFVKRTVTEHICNKC